MPASGERNPNSRTTAPAPAVTSRPSAHVVTHVHHQAERGAARASRSHAGFNYLRRQHYHYNADFSTVARIANIHRSDGRHVAISSPRTRVDHGISTMTITLYDRTVRNAQRLQLCRQPPSTAGGRHPCRPPPSAAARPRSPPTQSPALTFSNGTARREQHCVITVERHAQRHRHADNTTKPSLHASTTPALRQTAGLWSTPALLPHGTCGLRFR